MTTVRDECAAALQRPNVAAFLRVIRQGESSQYANAYNMLVGGGHIDSLEKHPKQRVYVRRLDLYSTAAGAYQFIASTWDECAKALDLPDFSESSQDLAAVFLIRRRGALEDVIAGRFEAAVTKCNREWASLPGDVYGQGGLSMEKAKEVYTQHGGSFADKEKPVTPIVAAVLPDIISAIPRLLKKFGSGSDVSDRNIGAAEVIVDTVVKATNAVNAQDAAEKVKADPEMARKAAEAIDAAWWKLEEAGGGGLEGARKADLEMTTLKAFWYSPSFWMGVFLLPLVYLFVLSLIGVVGKAEWEPAVRAALAGAITGSIVGGLVGYYYGQTTSRNRV